MTYVHDAGVDVAKLFETKESGAVSRVIEDVGLYQSVRSCSNKRYQKITNSSGIDGDGTRVGGRVRFLAVCCQYAIAITCRL